MNVSYLKFYKVFRKKQKSFGILKKWNINAIKYQDRLRSEWE